ncbi:recombination protein RecR [Candidatus Peregrinibacteria bacterium]|nr:recombination protein RecR [Candidatus Peregrinibacteria bacterium]
MLPKSLKKLINSLSKLPGIGPKTAQRLAYFLLQSHRSLANDIGDTLLHIKDEVTLCSECNSLADMANKASEEEPIVCGICNNGRRDHQTICVVEHVFDAEAIERSGEYAGVYHVLHGRIAPLDDVTPDDLKIKELVERIKKHNARGEKLEIILATNPSSEGETTAFYLQKLLQPFGVKITRIATGIPIGADIEYADEVTLGRAIKGRQNY